MQKNILNHMRQFSIQWLTLGMALLLLGSVMCFFLARQHSFIDAQEQTRLSNLSKVITANIEHQLDATNRALVGIRNDLPYLKPEEDGRSRTNHRLRALSDAMPGVRIINIINAAGITVGSNWEELIGSNFADRDYFKAPRQHPDPALLYVSAPFKTVLGVFAMNLVRVVTGPGGEFAGIVAATLDPEFFTVLLKSVLYVPDMRASVNHGEGRVFLLVPDSKGVEGMDLAKPGSFYTRHTESKQTASLFKGLVYATGDERMIAIRTVTSDKFIMDTPLMVAVSRDLAAIFATWRNEAVVIGVFFWVLALATGCGLYIYQRREGKFSRIETGHVARLQESEERYRTLFTRAGDGIILLSGDGTLVEVNESFARMHGYSAQEMRNMNLKDLDTSETAQLFHERKNRLLDKGTLTFEVEHYHKDGHVFPLEVSDSLISSGGTSFIQCFHRDITNRKRSEQALREGHRRLEFALQGGGLGMWDWFPQTGAVVYSDLWAQMLDYRPDEVEPNVEFFKRHIHPEDLPAVLDRLTVHVEGRAPVYESEHRLHTKSGRWLWVLDRGMVVEWGKDGSPVRVIGIIIDITDRKQTEAGLHQSEEKFSKAFQTSPYAIIITRAEDGKFVDVNDAFTSMTGFTREESIVGSSIGMKLWVNEKDRQIVVAALHAGQSVVGKECQFRTKSGKVITGLFSAQMIRLSHGFCILSSINDITERKRAEEEKAKLEAQLQQAQKMESIGTLAGGIAHDFNNILSVIIGHTEVLNLADDIDTSVRNSLDQIFTASQRAKQLVLQILAFSRHGKQEKILIDLKPIVKESLEFLRASLPTLIELRHYLEPTTGTIMADPSQMQQILMNLCVNASHAMEKDGGVLQIKLSNTALTEEDTRFDPEVAPGGFVKLTVSDTGHGMEPSVRERIFDPYFTTKEPGKGTGLGLAVVHGIVKSHGGMIKVYSEVGKGTTFTIFLPRAMGFEKVADTPLQPLARGTEKILFVDDESALADLGQQRLGELGYQVETRTSPIEALEAFRANPQKFDLVITDLAMPQMSGLNLARKIMEIRPGMPIILCTGFSEQANEQAAGAIGIRAFLFKPLVMRDIAAAVRKVLDECNPKSSI